MYYVAEALKESPSAFYEVLSGGTTCCTYGDVDIKVARQQQEELPSSDAETKAIADGARLHYSESGLINAHLATATQDFSHNEVRVGKKWLRCNTEMVHEELLGVSRGDFHVARGV